MSNRVYVTQVVWSSDGMERDTAKETCERLIDLHMDFRASVERSESGYKTYRIDVIYTEEPEEEQEVVGSQPGFMYDFKRREDGYMETSYPLCGDFDYFVELNGKVVEWGHTFHSAREARCRLIGDVKVLAKKRKGQTSKCSTG